MKFANMRNTKKYTRAPDYPRINRAAVQEMYRQVGDLQIDDDGLATRGLLVRHLILPRNLAGTKEIIKFLVDKISANTYLNLMSQYHTAYNASRFPEMNRRITVGEYNEAVQTAKEVGMVRLDGDFLPL